MVSGIQAPIPAGAGRSIGRRVSTTDWTVIVNAFFRLPPVRFLASLKLSVLLLAIFAIAIGKATFIENRLGADGARDLVYNARWFEIVLGLLILNLALTLFARAPYKPRQWGSVVVHVAVIWILVAAAITRYMGFEGVMPIREGATVDYMFSRATQVQLEIDGDNAAFPVRLYRAGPTGIARTVEADGARWRVSVDEYWPHYAERLQAADSGPAGLRLALSRDEGVEDLFLLEDERRAVDGLAMLYRNGPLPESTGAAPWGRVRVHVGDETTSFNVPDAVPASFSAGDWRFTVTEFQADFRVGGDTDYTRTLNNPMIRLEVVTPDGRTGEKILFAYHPDFSMGHSGAEEDFPGLDVLYQLERGVSFGRATDGALVARASMPLVSVTMEGGAEPVELPAGETFPVAIETIYRSQSGGPALLVREAMDHVRALPGSSDDDRAPAAARISVTGPDGASAQAVVVQNDDRGETVTLGDRQAVLRLGAVVVDLPYSLHLDDFLLLTYPGSRNPASYESHVRLYDPEQGIDGRPVRIYMNHPLTHRGFKHFQSSYDPDEKGTVLSVNYDPGKVPTYLGYGLLTLGFLLILLRDLFWPARKSDTEGRA